MSKGFSLIILVISVIALSAAIAGGTFFIRTKFLNKTPEAKIAESKPVEIKKYIEVKVDPLPLPESLIASGSSTLAFDPFVPLKCEEDKAELVVSAQKEYNQAVSDYAVCTKNNSTTTGNCDQTCQQNIDTQQKNCNVDVNSKKISIDEFAICMDKSTKEYKNCLTNCSNNPQTGFKKSLTECNYDFDLKVKQFTEAVHKYCQ